LVGGGSKVGGGKVVYAKTFELAPSLTIETDVKKVCKAWVVHRRPG
jgi:hypothetical protein